MKSCKKNWSVAVIVLNGCENIHIQLSKLYTNFIPRTFKESKHIYLVGHNEGIATIKAPLEKKSKHFITFAF